MGEPVLYDLIVVGGGSGGIAAANRAASYGAKVLLVEAKRLGGTCVNLGCVPKKIMWCAGSVADAIHLGPAYGFPELKSQSLSRFDWGGLKAKRDAFIKRLNGIYEGNLKKNGVTIVSGWGKLISPRKVSITPLDNEPEMVVEGKHVLIATGSHGIMPTGMPGVEHAICSDGFFALETQPERVAVVGSGYIGVELTGVFKALGSAVDMFIRTSRVLTHFDMTLQTHLTKNLRASGVKLFPESNITRIEKGTNGEVMVEYEENGSTLKAGPYDCILYAIGRAPMSAKLGLEACGVSLNANGSIPVDEYQNVLGAEGLHAVGDVTGVHMLTPVAIAAGRKLSDRLFGGKPDAKQDYELIPSVVFSHPPCGAIGLTEAEARAKYGSDAIKVYESTFNDLFYSMVPLVDDPAADEHVHKTPSVHKLVVEGPNERIVGLHIIGRGSDEILQGFGVAMKMGATKADFDRCVAIHPTAAEELVTMR
jgi:glutathione reductase (NADPH)